MASITRFLAEALKLTVNTAKSAVAPPWTRNTRKSAMPIVFELRLMHLAGQIVGAFFCYSAAAQTGSIGIH